MRRATVSRRFYRVVVLIFAALLLVEWIPNTFSVKEPAVHSLNSLQTKEIETFVTMVQLLISLTTAAAGALIAIVFNRYQKESLPLIQTRRAIAAWSLMGVSLYSGHLSYQNLLRMLHNSFFNMFQARIVWPSRLQFWSFLLSIAVVADFVIDSFRKEYEP